MAIAAESPRWAVRVAAEVTDDEVRAASFTGESASESITTADAPNGRDKLETADNLSSSFASIPSTVDTAGCDEGDDELKSSVAPAPAARHAAMPTLLAGAPSGGCKSQTLLDACLEKFAELRSRKGQEVPSDSLAAQARQAVPGEVPHARQAGPLAIYSGQGASAQRASVRRSISCTMLNLEEPKTLSRVESETALKLNSKLVKLTEMARATTPTATPRASAEAQRSRTPPRAVPPLRARTPPRNLAPAGYTSFAPFPAAAFGTAKRTPVVPYGSRFETTPNPDAYTLKPWSPIAEGKTVSGAAMDTASREPIKTWQSRFERTPSACDYKAKAWSSLCEGKGVAGVSAFGKELRLPKGSVPDWLRTSATEL
eukprot:gb/GFBE01071286.1/.p1 GENE.gb/GFBE01071286.1/~~gb/GFBE01071286.1/.p1  ORF type:complete len:372 (+),score=36.63 gb/GFBE01071286.1/:1-1116(+)